MKTPASAVVLAFATLTACGGSNPSASANATAPVDIASLVRGSWKCVTEGGTAGLGGAYDATYMSDGAATFIGSGKQQVSGKLLEIDYVSRARWTAGNDILQHTITQMQHTRGAFGGEADANIGRLNTLAADDMKIHPENWSTDSRIITLTTKELVTAEPDGATTTCKRIET